MSSKDGSGAGAGQGDRTVFRPNPGGRAPIAAGVPAADHGNPGVPISGAGRPAEGWLPNSEGQAAALPPAAVLQMGDLVSANANPIMRAASPILLLLGGLRVAILKASLDSLMDQVAEAIKFFEKDIKERGLKEDQVRSAQYVLCAAADDIVLNIHTAGKQEWARYSMQYRFFKGLIGGELFFTELDKAIADPTGHYELLELIHCCLAIGFQGRYRVQPNGMAQLPQVQRHVYETLRRVRPKATLELSPHWRGQAFGRRLWATIVPTWVVGAVTAALLLGAFVAMRATLGSAASEAQAMLIALHPTTPIEIKRRQPAPPPPPVPPQAQIDRVAAALPKGICIADRHTAIAVRTCGLSLFASGSDVVLGQYRPLVASLAAVINSEAALNPQPTPLWVVGHTDKTKPGRTDRFSSNAELSKARADAVAALLKPQLKNPERVRTDGKADTDPVDPHDTPQAYALNRRVEILIPRND